MTTSPRIRSTTSAFVASMLCAVVASAGCSQQKPDDRLSTADTVDTTTQQTPPEPAPPSLPQTKQGTIMIEGSEEPITLELFDAAPYSLPLLFTTYIPADMIAEQVPAAEGPGVRFVSNFDGKRNADAFLQVGFFPVGTTDEQARAEAKALAGGSGRKARASDGKAYDWSLVEHTYTGSSGAVGRIALGRQADRYYYTRSEYPPEFGDGFGPRVGIIFAELKWGDADVAGIEKKPAR